MYVGLKTRLSIAVAVTTASVMMLASAASIAASRIDYLELDGTNNGKAGLKSSDRASVLADKNRDGMADGLAHTLATMSENSEIKVKVLMKPSGSVGKAQDAVGGFKLRHSYSLISGFSATVNAGQAKALSKLPFVERVEQVYDVRPILEGGRNDTGVTPLRTVLGGGAGYGTGAGVGICFVDSGIYANHESFVPLGSSVSKITHGFYGISGPDFGETTDLNLLSDDFGHGTHVASIAAADGDDNGDGSDSDGFAEALSGIAPDANIIPVKVIGAGGTGADDDVEAGVEWCAQQPDVDIINLSIRGDATRSDGLDTMSLIVNAAVQAGKVVIAGTGNSDYPNDLGPPASAHLAISVGAYGERSISPDLQAAATVLDGGVPGAQTGAITSSYSYGPYTTWFSTRGVTEDGRTMPDVVAPGDSVIAAASNVEAPCGNTSCYISKSGTSMSTPMVSGIAALILEANPNLTPDEVRQIIFDTAEHRGPNDGGGDPAKSRHWGYGMVDAYAAVSLARGMGGLVEPSPSASQTMFPSSYLYGEELINKADHAEIPFTVTSSDAPLTIMLTAPEDATVETFPHPIFPWLIFMEIKPDFDIFLHQGPTIADPVIASSICPGGPAPHCNVDLQYGLQETISINNPTPGDYLLEIQFLDNEGTPPSLNSAVATYQISHGPLAIASGNSVPNPAPIADAGSDATIDTTTVILDGSASSDAGGIKLYAWQWSINGGPSTSSSATTSVIGFSAADGDVVTAKLTVIDNLGASASDDVVITIDMSGGANQAPVAADDTNWAHEDVSDASGNVLLDMPHAGAPSGAFADVVDSDPDFDGLTVTGHVGGDVYGALTLNGDGSYTYILNDAHAAVEALNDGETLNDVYTYTVSDGALTDNGTLTITIFGSTDPPPLNLPPVAIASSDQPIQAVGKGKSAFGTVTLTSTSTDPDDGIAEWRWSSGSEVEFDEITTMDLPKGTHTITLLVTDVFGDSDSVDICVEIYNKNPAGTCGPVEPPPPPPPGDTGTISGKAKNGKKNAGGETISVDKGAEHFDTVTPKNGQFSFSGLGLGDWILSGCGAAPIEVSVVTAGQIVTQNLACAP